MIGGAKNENQVGAPPVRALIAQASLDTLAASVELGSVCNCLVRDSQTVPLELLPS